MSYLIYPRLPFSAAEQRVAELSELMRESGLSAVKQLVGIEHPRAAPVATGGRLVSTAHLLAVRDLTVKRLEPWLSKGEVGRSQASDFDAALGAVLHETLEIVPADAAHAETWNFLSLVVFPDVAVARFPALHRDRLLGTQRNALRRAWLRQEVLGDLMQMQDRGLGEDELVGLFERTALARNRHLLRRLAVAVLEYDGNEGRSAWARDLYKRVTFATGPVLLDALSDSEIDDLIHGRDRLAAGPAAHMPTEEASEPRGSWFRDKLSRAQEFVSRSAPIDVEPEGAAGTDELEGPASDALSHQTEPGHWSSDQSATGTARGPAAVGGRRDVGAHIAAVFQSLPLGSFLTVNEIVNRESPQYRAGEVSGGAVLYRLRTGRPIPGVEPVIHGSPMGARRALGHGGGA